MTRQYALTEAPGCAGTHHTILAIGDHGSIFAAMMKGPRLAMVEFSDGCSYAVGDIIQLSPQDFYDTHKRAVARNIETAKPAQALAAGRASFKQAKPLHSGFDNAVGAGYRKYTDGTVVYENGRTVYGNGAVEPV